MRFVPARSVRRRRGPALLAASSLLLAAAPAGAWPDPLLAALNRDARRLLPRALAGVLAAREERVRAQLVQFPAPLSEALAADSAAGRLRPETLAACDARIAEVLGLFKQRRRVGEGLIHFGALLRIPADLADPVIAAGPGGLPPAVVQEYQLFVQDNLVRIPVVLVEPAALELKRAELPAYWQRLSDEARDQVGVIRAEMLRGGRAVDHRAIDYRSPVFAVASLQYSRTVTAIAATWLAVWREAGGDLTRRPRPIEISPYAPASVLPTPGPSHAAEGR
jgi:hypothetical protein